MVYQYYEIILKDKSNGLRLFAHLAKSKLALSGILVSKSEITNMQKNSNQTHSVSLALIATISGVFKTPSILSVKE